MTEGHPIEDNESFMFQTIPSLKELLPSTAGIPGIQYAQICVNNMKRAQNDGWKRIQGAKIYTVLGPDGRADMELLAQGKVISGQAYDSGARRCWIDPNVYTLTGHSNPKEKPNGGPSRKPQEKEA